MLKRACDIAFKSAIDKSVAGSPVTCLNDASMSANGMQHELARGHCSQVETRRVLVVAVIRSIQC